jgi:hypothetical protein
VDIYHPSGEMDEWDYSPDPLDWDYDKEEDLALHCWTPLKRIFIRK